MRLHARRGNSARHGSGSEDLFSGADCAEAEKDHLICVRPTAILETALYGSDVEGLAAFYTRVLGLEPLQRLGPQGSALVCGRSVLLLFDSALTSAQRGDVPAHGTKGRGHVAFSIKPAEFEEWRRQLDRSGVPVESEVDWPRGGHSLYFRDPAGNSVELTTPATWGMDEQPPGGEER